jgi:hypothetical protein
MGPISRLLVCPRMPEGCPLPGVYLGIAPAEYFRWAAVSSSMLNKARRSAGHARHWMNTEDNDTTESKEFGTLIHGALLEPARFEAGVIPWPKHEKGQYIGKPMGVDSKGYQDYAAANPGKFILCDEDRAALEAIRANVAENEDAANLIGGDGENEVSIVWIDEATGLPCKARVDRRLKETGILADIKCVRNADVFAFESAIAEYGYHVQAAHYLEHAADFDYLILCIENCGHYPVRVVRLHPDAVACGRQERRELMAVIEKAVRTGEWPSYPKGIVDVALPAWKMAQFVGGAL